MAPTAVEASSPLSSNPDLSMPLISLAPIITSSPTTKQTAGAILDAFRTFGFLYITDFSSIVSPSLLHAVFDHSAKFFIRPQSQKDSLEWAGPRSNRGYSSMGREKASHGLTKEEVAKDRVGGGEDLKESFEMSREGKEGYPNRWPDGFDQEGAEFKSIMMSFYEKCKQIHALVLRAIAIGMKLDPDFFEDYVRVGDNTLRLLHYPAVPTGAFDAGSRIRAGAHTDFGSITLLFQDQRGGLQVEQPGGGKWLDVLPIEGTMIVNAGDLLARWSNDLIRSTKHRVVEPPSTRANPGGGHLARYSVVYFGNPDFDRWIDALPGTWEHKKDGKRYKGINAGDYVADRLSAIYGAERK